MLKKILADVHFSTQQEFDEYLKNHPNYREDTKFFVNGVQVKAPTKEKNNDSSEMTDEQKIIDSMTNEQKHLHSVANETFFSGSGIKVDVAAFATHPYTLHKLSEDESENVRGSVASNSNVPLEIIEKLSDDKSEKVRLYLLENRYLPFEIMMKLFLDDESLRVRNKADLTLSEFKRKYDAW